MKFIVLFLVGFWSVKSTSGTLNFSDLSKEQNEAFARALLQHINDKVSGKLDYYATFQSHTKSFLVAVPSFDYYRKKMLKQVEDVLKQKNPLDSINFTTLTDLTYSISIKGQSRSVPIRLMQKRPIPSKETLEESVPFDFAYIPSKGEELSSAAWEYIGHYEYTSTFLPEESLSYSEIFNKRNALYAKNSPDVLSLTEFESTQKVPSVIHFNWGMRAQNVIELNPKTLSWLLGTLYFNNREMGWSHILWLNRPERFPATTKIMNEMGIEVRDISTLEELPKEPELWSYIQKMIALNKHADASDVFRLLVLKYKGGVYQDLDYELFGSLLYFNKFYDFYTSVEPKSPFLAQAFLAAKPFHPVILKSLELIARNINPKKQPLYVRDLNAVFKTGPFLVTIAAHLSADLEGNIDVMLPPVYLFPSPDGTFPGGCFKPGDPIQACCFGAHYWAGSWF